MQWWASEPVVYVKSGELESNRVRLLLAEKRAAAVKVLAPDDPIPEFLLELNPDHIYPFLVCKGVACYGHALDELLHERYPAPQLLPVAAIERARIRCLSDMVRSWYSMPPSVLRLKLGEVAGTFDPTLTFCSSDSLTVLDVAIAALLFDVKRIGYRFQQGTPFAGYARMILARPSFSVLQRPQIAYAEMRPPSTRLEGAA